MNQLQSSLLALHNNDENMAKAISAGVFYAAATILGTHHAALPLTELPDGTSFPSLCASAEEAQAELDEEIEDRRAAIEAGDLEADSDDDEDDFDLAVVEVRWAGGDEFEVDGRPVTLEKIQQGSF